MQLLAEGVVLLVEGVVVVVVGIVVGGDTVVPESESKVNNENKPFSQSNNT